MFFVKEVDIPYTDYEIKDFFTSYRLTTKKKP